MLTQSRRQSFALTGCLQREESVAKQPFAQAVKNVLGRAHVVGKAKPENVFGLYAVGLQQPVNKAASQRGLADASQAVNQQPRWRTVHGPFQSQHGGVSTNEAVRVVRVDGVFGECCCGGDQVWGLVARTSLLDPSHPN